MIVTCAFIGHSYLCITLSVIYSNVHLYCNVARHTHFSVIRHHMDFSLLSVWHTILGRSNFPRSCEPYTSLSFMWPTYTSFGILDNMHLFWSFGSIDIPQQSDPSYTYLLIVNCTSIGHRDTRITLAVIFSHVHLSCHPA